MGSVSGGARLEVVGDENEAKMMYVGKFETHIDDLRLDRWVKRRCWFISDDQRRVGGQCSCDGHSLTLPATEVGRVPRGELPPDSDGLKSDLLPEHR